MFHVDYIPASENIISKLKTRSDFEIAVIFNEIFYVWRIQNSTYFILNTYCLWKLHVLHKKFIWVFESNIFKFSKQQQFWNCSYFQWQKSKWEKIKPLLNPEKNKLFTKTYFISWQILFYENFSLFNGNDLTIGKIQTFRLLGVQGPWTMFLPSWTTNGSHQGSPGHLFSWWMTTDE